MVKEKRPIDLNWAEHLMGLQAVPTAGDSQVAQIRHKNDFFFLAHALQQFLRRDVCANFCNLCRFTDVETLTQMQPAAPPKVFVEQPARVKRRTTQTVSTRRCQSSWVRVALE